MPKCKYCGENITKFDKEICPYCGGRSPIDKNRMETNDITQVIAPIDEKSEVSTKTHSKIINGILVFLLGVFGVDAFYLGYIKEGLIRLATSIILYGAMFVLFYLLIFSKNILISLLIPVGVLYFIYIFFGIIICLKRKKDANGEFLR